MTTLLLALTGAAMARPSPALLEVDNDFEGEVEVYVDGRYEGTVPGDRTLRMDVQPGRRAVRIQRPRGGAVLKTTSLHFQHGVISGIVVETPLTRLQVLNTGTVPLSVDFGPGDDIWVAPSSSVELRVPAGTVHLTASAQDRDGLRRVRDETLWVEPGTRHQHAFDYTPPPPTRLSLWNPSGEPLRALVDGREVGWLSPGETQLVHVDPGRTEVRFYDRFGRLSSVLEVKAERGTQTRVAAAASPPPRPPHHDHGHDRYGHGDRPDGPLRTSSTSSGSCSSSSGRTVAVR